MVRWHDPVHGSGVAYYDTVHNKIAISTSYMNDNDFVTYPSAAQLPNPPSVMDLAGLALFGIGLGLAAAGIAIALAPATLAVGALIGIIGVAVSIIGLITAMFGWSGCQPSCPQAAPPRIRDAKSAKRPKSVGPYRTSGRLWSGRLIRRQLSGRWRR